MAMPSVLRLRRASLLPLLSLLLLAWLVHAEERRSRVDSKPAIIATASQCNAHTINYITHSLPQSCLTSARPNPASASVEPSTAAAAGAGRQQVASKDASPTTTTSTQETSSSQADTVLPTASDDANGDPIATPFMLFEDWKEMMLRRAGQDPQEIRQRKSSGHGANDRAPPEFGDSGLGEEGEISLVFDDYHGERSGGHHAHVGADHGGTGSDSDAARLSDDEKTMHRSQDAGKTCKERFSYSSFDGGATILKTGQGTKNAKAILVENQDSYMLLECAAQNKFIIVELSDDILIDTVVIANFEFFSSMIRHFRVSVSDRYPVKMEKWRDLGIFEARNSRDIQAFLVQNPQIWAKYVRLEFLTHYGNEYYCPVSLLRVHGSRMLDSWKDSETGHEEVARDEEAAPPTLSRLGHLPAATSFPAIDRVGNNLSELVAASQLWSDRFAQDFFHQLNATCAISSAQSDGRWTEGVGATSPGDSNAAQRSQPAGGGGGGREGASSSVPANLARPESAESGDKHAISMKRDPTSASHNNYRQATPVDSDDTAGPAGSGASLANTSTAAMKATSSGGSGAKRNGWTTSANAASPTVQESFFNTVTKRLQQVETNLTLSLKYVEDQSRHIQDVLQKAEQKQLTRLTLFVGELNQTVLTELRKVQDQYDQIWQSTVLALESQRDQSERDIVALSTRLNVLADEVVFQKRMAIVQAVLLLSCLFLVIFSRGTPIAHLIPPQEESGTAPCSSPLSTSKEGHLENAANFDIAPQEKPCKGDDRFVAVRASSEGPHSSVDLFESRAIGQDDTSSISPKMPAVAESSTCRSRTVPAQGVQAPTLLRRPANSSNSVRKPLPSLPEHPLPTDGS